MSTYAFEDYDAFLASFGAGRLGEHPQQQQQQQQSHSGSLSTVLTGTDDDDVLFNSMYADYQDQQPQAHTLLSPDYTTSASSSPNEFSQLPIDGSNFADFNFANGNFAVDGGANNVSHGKNSMASDFNIEANVKQEESMSSQSSSTGSPLDCHITANSNNTTSQSSRIKLADAVPRGGSISKRGAKKEKSSHNMIEKRYRTNINDKIKALRDSVPALRVLVDSGDDDFDDLEGLQPAKKLNKATILSKATEYIKHLESKNEVLKKQNDELKAKLYGYGQMTPGSSVSSVSTDGQDGMSLGNKVLLGGMACMVGAGLTDDFGAMDTKSLFALPVLGYDTTGLQLLSKPLMVLLKASFVFTVLLYFVLPSFFQKKDRKQTAPFATIVDDVRGLKTRSILSTFSLTTDSNIDYVKSAIFRCLLLKVRYTKSNSMTLSAVNAYVSHLWAYLKDVKIEKSSKDYESVKTILSLDASETIDNKNLLSKISKYCLTNNVECENDFSVCYILSHMINEKTTNSFLRKFMVETLTTEKSIPEIEQELIPHIDEQNLELLTLFHPTEANILNYKTMLESASVSSLKSDDILVLISGITQNLIFEKKDYASARRWFTRVEALQHADYGLLGFTALYMTVLSIISTEETYLHDKNVILKIEEISAVLRIWLGNSNGSVLNFKKRSQLIDFFVKMSLRINGLDGDSDDSMTLVSF